MKSLVRRRRRVEKEREREHVCAVEMSVMKHRLKYDQQCVFNALVQVRGGNHIFLRSDQCVKQPGDANMKRTGLHCIAHEWNDRSRLHSLRPLPSEELSGSPILTVHIDHDKETNYSLRLRRGCSPSDARKRVELCGWNQYFPRKSHPSSACQLTSPLSLDEEVAMDACRRGTLLNTHHTASWCQKHGKSCCTSRSRCGCDTVKANQRNRCTFELYIIHKIQTKTKVKFHWHVVEMPLLFFLFD